MSKLIDLAGKEFGRLKVIERAHNRNKKSCWICKCECGNVVFVDGQNLRTGNTKSCGCLHKDHSSFFGKKKSQYALHNLY